MNQESIERLSKVMKLDYEEGCGEHTFKKVALFSSDNLTDKEAGELINGGEIMDDRIIYMYVEQFEKVFGISRE